MTTLDSHHVTNCADFVCDRAYRAVGEPHSAILLRMILENSEK